MSSPSCGARLSGLLHYETTKYVSVPNRLVGALYYSVVAIIIAYIVVYVIVLEKGYQSTDSLQSITVVKLKGAGVPGDSLDQSLPVFDAVDSVVPPKENNALFVMTNYLATTNQRRTTCPGNAATELPPCIAGRTRERGIDTGISVQTPNGTYCMMRAWCPMEMDDDDPTNVIPQVDAWSLFIRVNIRWIHKGVVVDNAHGSQPTPGWNLFNVSEMLRQAGTTYKDVAATGAVIAVRSQWDCNLDYSPRYCQPLPFQFIRVDSNQSDFSTGYNFRYGFYSPSANLTNSSLPANDVLNGMTRNLMKVLGIRFVFVVGGTGGYFDFVPLALNIGSGLGLLSIASVIADKVLVYACPKRRLYRAAKYEELADGEQRFSFNGAQYDDIEEQSTRLVVPPTGQ